MHGVEPPGRARGNEDGIGWDEKHHGSTTWQRHRTNEGECGGLSTRNGTGEVGATRDAVTIIRETCRTRHVEVTETRIINETRGETNKHEETTKETKGVTETQITRSEYFDIARLGTVKV